MGLEKAYDRVSGKAMQQVLQMHIGDGRLSNENGSEEFPREQQALSATARDFIYYVREKF